MGSDFSGCSPLTLAAAYGGGGIVVFAAGGLLCKVAYNGVIQLGKKVNQYFHGYQYRNDTHHMSELLMLGGGALMATSGVSHPYVTLAIAGVTVASNFALLRYSPSTRGLEPESSEPLIIDESSAHYLDAENCLFTVEPNAISCHSIGAALELMKTSETYRRTHRQDLENKSAEFIRAFYTAHPLGQVALKVGFDFGGNAKNLMELKYGVVSANPTQEQLDCRKALLETWEVGSEHPQPLRHPPIPGVPLSADQLSGWLQDIRQKLYTQSQQPHGSVAQTPTATHDDQ
jgi:hypothetical protein